MTTLPNLDLMSPNNREYYACGLAPNDPFRHNARNYWARHFVSELGKAARGTDWYRGRIMKGHGASEDGVCYVAWLNSCPLTVVEKPAELRKYGEEGQPVFGYRFRFIVGGHFSGSAETLAGAVQEAMVGALRSGREGSDSKWINSKGGKQGFFAFHGVDTGSADAMKLADFMVPEFMSPVPVREGPYAELAAGIRP